MITQKQPDNPLSSDHNTPANSGNPFPNTPANTLHTPNGIELPQGGGAIHGIGEKTQVNPVNGTGTVTIPLPVTSGRSGFTPQLTLSYNSGSGNSSFGLGWNIDLPAITRKTEKELPRYFDAIESDTYILAGAEDLVPLLDENGNIIEQAEEGYTIRRYRPRIEGLHAKIERLFNTRGDSYWRITDKNNNTSLYGHTAQARISDPHKSRKAFAWYIQYTLDSHGNLIRYNYDKDNNTTYDSLYPTSVQYGNNIPVDNIQAAIQYEGSFYFELKIIYTTDRFDPFSIFKPGFEIRNTRLCTAIEMHHHIGNTIKTKELLLEYDDSTGISLLTSATLQGYDTEGILTALPSLSFRYTAPLSPGKVKNLDPHDLENIPGGLNSYTTFTDLWNEGISGVLVKSSHAWYYKSNCGNRQWINPGADDQIDLGKLSVLKEIPSLATNHPDMAQITDIDGDGLNEIQILTEQIKGWHTFDETGKLDKFVPFKEMPNIDLADSNLRMIDLNGDGLPDLLLTEQDCFLTSYSKGKEGYSQLKRISQAIDDNQGPRILFSETRQTIFLADMTGDGLSDIVRITNGAVCYWPNLGYGRFGHKRPMPGAPRFDHPDRFDPGRIRLADIDGSGTTDIVYLGNTQTTCWKNLNGNSWSQSQPIFNFPPVDNHTNVSIFDIEGNGTSAIVWSSPLPGYRENIKYIELTAGKKPFLLHTIDNNMGAIRSLYYAPSTKFYLQDKKAGKPWITRIGFPVHTVERIETEDLSTGALFISRYAYHHGYFDPAEREFRGFGMVEQWDTEDYETHGNSINVREGDAYPAYIKTWFHTGFYKYADNISALFKEEYFDQDSPWILPDTILPEGLTTIEKREAARALKGSVLRREIYGQDGFERENIPYMVEEYAYTLQIIQTQKQNKHAIFLPLPGETIVLNYEREEAPRINHTLNLQYDPYGNLIKQATAAYRNNDAIVGDRLQGITLVSLQENSYFNTTENDTFHRIGVLYESVLYEIHGLEAQARKITPQDLEGKGQTRIRHQRIYYYTQNLESDLKAPLGAIPPHGLIYQTETLALTPETQIFGLDITAMIIQGYLINLSENTCWIPSERQKYDPYNFCLPYAQIDPMGNKTELEYDVYNLQPVIITDPLGFATSIEYDYAQMQPVTLTDPNLNFVQLKLNGLGLVEKQALGGKTSTTGEPIVTPMAPGGPPDPEYNYEGDKLTSPTVEYQYHLNNWTENNLPVYTHIRIKTTHQTNTSYIEQYAYTGGLGQTILTKTTAEDGTAYDSQGNQINTNTRFVASGRIIYNNKGAIVKQYEPWYSNNPGYETNESLVQFGVTPIMRYDPIGRLIQTDYPDGTTTQTIFTSWEQHNYDQNDCDPQSPHYDTPQTVKINPMGIPCQTIDDNINEQIVTTQITDILRQVTEVIDALGRTATQNTYDLTGNLIQTQNIDSGIRTTLYNAAALPAYQWDSRGQQHRYEYDQLLRPTNEYLLTTGRESLVQQTLYGTDPEKRNIGQIAQSNAQDGKTTFELYDFKGNILTLSKQFANKYTGIIDYNRVVTYEAKIYQIQNTYNALNQILTVTQPDGTTVTNTYDKGALLTGVQHDGNEYILRMEYNARGQREVITYANGVRTNYYYDNRNFRLVRIYTRKATNKLQDLNYTYDAIGNITAIRDEAQQFFYFNNAVIEPVSTFQYDALYRLIKAEGREQASLGMPGYEDFSNLIPNPNSDPNAMQNYTQTYTYDKLGNILQQKSAGNWTRNFIYDQQTNRLLKHDARQTLNDYSYDQHGNITSMPHLSTITWNHNDQMQSATNGTQISYFRYDAQGNRTRKIVTPGAGNLGNGKDHLYIGGYEVLKYTSPAVEENYQRITIKLSDDTKTFVLIERQTTLIGSTVRYQYDNHLGSACLELDEWANIISYEEYHPFGTTSYRAGRSYIETSLKRYKYCGKERDEETGLYYYGARYYAAWLCRWVSTDPMKEERTWVSPYNYCQNNPITITDLNGELDDWVQVNGEMIYDSRVYNQEDATALYGKDAIHRPVGFSYTSTTGNLIELGDYGFFKNDGEISISSDLAEKSLAYTNPSQAEIEAQRQIENIRGDYKVSLAVSGFIITDTSIPDPTDAAWPKWAAYALAGGVAAYYVLKMEKEIEGIKRRAGGQQGVQYSLRTTSSGNYPSYNHISGTMEMNMGDVWKYGETTNPTGRYSDNWLQSSGLRQYNEFKGNQVQIKVMEKTKIYGYFLQHGHLPPGNKIFR